MKKIRSNRYRKLGESRKRCYEPGASPTVRAPAGLAKCHVKVDTDGREHFAVPLIGPTHKPGTPYLIAHFFLPPPKEREALIEELARIIARAAVDHFLKGCCTD